MVISHKYFTSIRLGPNFDVNGVVPCLHYATTTHHKNAELSNSSDRLMLKKTCPERRS